MYTRSLGHSVRFATLLTVTNLYKDHPHDGATGLEMAAAGMTDTALWPISLSPDGVGVFEVRDGNDSRAVTFDYDRKVNPCQNALDLDALLNKVG